MKNGLGYQGRAFAWKWVVSPLIWERYNGDAEMRFNKQKEIMSREYFDGIIVDSCSLTSRDIIEVWSC